MTGIYFAASFYLFETTLLLVAIALANYWGGADLNDLGFDEDDLPEAL